MQDTYRSSKLGTPGHSAALQFEVELQELQGGGAPSPSKTSKCFQVFDQIIPHLGAYQRVLHLIKRELYMAVYSSDWTSGGRQAHKSEPNASLTPVPYFVIAQRLTEKKAGERSKFKSEISSLKEQLYTCEADLEKAISSLDVCRHDMRDRDAKLHHLTSELRTQCVEKENLKEIISNNQQTRERLHHDFEFRMFSLQTTINTLKEENGGLRKFKHTHDQLQETSLLPVQLKNELVPANSKNEIQQHIASTKQLKVQLLTVQNSLMDELDAMLQVCYRKHSQVLPAEVSHKKKAFKQKISALATELSLLDAHQQVLSERLEQLQAADKRSAHNALVIPCHPLNPLISQEQLSSKYAAMMYTSSDGGQNYYPLKVAQHCSSCAQKTVVCPHKLCQEDLVIQVPVNCSHIKIKRPSFKLVQPEKSAAPSIPKKRDKQTLLQQGLHTAVPDFGYFWEKFNSKFPTFELNVSRKISQMQLLELVRQFYATILLNDDSALVAVTDEEDGQVASLSECLFEFMRKHYLVKVLTAISCHAFIMALEQHHSENKELLLISHALCGDLDGSGFRYMLLQTDLVQMLTWHLQSQFPLFMSCIYPFLEEEDIEQMNLNYIAHSHNRLSAQCVLEFLQLLLLAHKDPLLVMLERNLTEQPSHVIGYMLETEFAEAMEKLVPSRSDLLCHRLFLQSLSLYQEKHNSKKQALPTRNLAYIAAYLYRLHTQDHLKTELTTRDATLQVEVDSNSREKSKNEVLAHGMDTVRNIMERINVIG